MDVITFGGMELVFLQTKETTGGSLDLFEMTLQPDAQMPVPHHHESWEETVYGLSGVTTFKVGGETINLSPGQSLFIKRGVVHGFKNTSGAPSRSLCLLTPGALGSAYFRELADLVAGGSPDPAKMKAVMLRYGLVPAPLS